MDENEDVFDQARYVRVQAHAKSLHICEVLVHAYGLTGGYNEDLNAKLDELVEYQNFEPKVDLAIPIFFFKHRLESRCMHADAASLGSGVHAFQV